MVSIIVPMHNASGHIRNCLQHISQLKDHDYEVIIVDDASGDDSRTIATEAGFIPIRKDRPEGPSTARNLGAKKARGELLFFVDSDVYLSASILTRLESALRTYPKVAGVAFIYSLEHPNKNFVSLYKNFSIRFEEMNKPDFTHGFRFSAFAIKKEVFDTIGGFDDNTGVAPCCEELEFSLKLSRHNLIFYLDKETDVIHAKGYSFRELIKGDFHRAYNYFKIFFRNCQRIRKNYSKMKRTFHLPFVQLLGISLAGLFMISSFFYAAGINLILCFLMIIIVAISQTAFLKDAYKTYGLTFALAALLLRNLEIVIGEVAMVIALINIFVKRCKKGLPLCLPI